MISSVPEERCASLAVLTELPSTTHILLFLGPQTAFALSNEYIYIYIIYSEHFIEPGTVINTTLSTHLILSTTPSQRLITLISQMRKPRHREVK